MKYDTWTPVPMFCANCGHLNYGYRNENGIIKYECKNCIRKELAKQKEKVLTEIERKISGHSRLQSEYYEKYVLGQWTKADFEREKEGLYQKKSELEDIKEKKIAFFEEEAFKLEEKHKYLKALLKGKTQKWDKDFVDSIIDKIFIGKDNTVEIKFNFEETSVFAEKIGGRKKRY